MSDFDYPSVMPGKLHLDPIPDPGTSTPAPAAPDITMGIGADGEMPRGLPSGGLPPALDPAKMSPVFGHYGPDADATNLEDQLDQELTLKTTFPGPLPSEKPSAWGPNSQGVGTNTKYGPAGFKPAMSTSDRFDNPDARDRAERTDRDTTDAQQRGEVAPDPVTDAVKGR